MRSRTTWRFRQCFERLPPEIKDKARDAYRLFLHDADHPSLRFKKVHQSESTYSVRITRDYRAVGALKEGEIIWFWIGSHAEYERLLP